jgi:hypothetical protein
MRYWLRKIYVSITSSTANFSTENSFPNAYSATKFDRSGGGVNYIQAREKGFRNAVSACVLLRKNFRNGVHARSVTKILLPSFNILSRNYPGILNKTSVNPTGPLFPTQIQTNISLTRYSSAKLEIRIPSFWVKVTDYRQVPIWG